ncbi:hypothetical protein [uncultured Aquabacterium sp.]|uniref:hypothetical protein n=1 Tax=uncultured Aquabacterium sp. TaxID=158753 RepID=UPI0030D39532
MPLTDAQRQAIRDEELFRDEVRRELTALGGKKAPPGLLERISSFFESKTGFWLLTTVLAGVTATGFTELRNYLNREEIAQRQAAERSRTDMETVLKLGPMLTSDNRTEADMAIILLDALLVDKAVNDRIAKPVLLLVQNTVTKGQSPNATPAEQGNANAILAYMDSARIDAIRRPDTSGASAAPAAAAPTPLLKALDQTALPARVYLQIGREADRPVATAAQKALREAGLIVPGIELVGNQRTPARNDLRYCADRVDEAVLARVRSAVNSAIQPAPVALTLPPAMCTKVRHNHFEIWYALQPT